MQNIKSRHVEDETFVRSCYPLMRQLRPRLASADEFVERWQRQTAEGYRLLALVEGDVVLALGGYRVQENLVYGRFLYVDDLVTDSERRGGGLGAQIIVSLKRQAAALGCVQFVLDTALSNALGQRFYFRNGLLSSALRFSAPVEGAGA
jgi:GNAT superfamily N-acetyltransferase